MKEIIFSFNPIFILVGIVLTSMAAFTAIDLFQHMKTIKNNRTFLFWGSCCSLSIAVWMMNFFGVLAFDISNADDQLIFVSLLSLFSSFMLTTCALLFFMTKKKWWKLPVGSIIMSIAVLFTSIIHMYAIEAQPEYNMAIILISFITLFILFIFPFWYLFFSDVSFLSKGVYKAISAAVITLAVGQSFFMVLKSSMDLSDNAQIFPGLSLDGYWFIYGFLFFSILAFGILLIVSIVSARRIERDNLFDKDIMAALETSAMVIVTDPQGKVTYVNNKFIEVFQYKREELIGKDSMYFLGVSQKKALWQKIASTYKAGEIWNGEFVNKAKDGSTYWLNATITPFLDKKGSPYQFVIILTDISIRKKIEKELESSLKEVHDYKYALDQASIVAVTDADGIITQVNDNFCRISKYTKQELVGKNHRIINSGFHPPEFFRQLWETIESGQVWQGEIMNMAKDGSHYWVDTTIVPFLDEYLRPYQYLAIRNDITDKKKQEELLIRQEKLSALGQLAAGVAHEIRNPLTSMRGYTEYLLLTEENDDKKEHLDIILDEIQRVDLIVEEFMMLAKPKKNQLVIRDLNRIIRQTIGLFAYEFKKKKVTSSFISYEEPVLVLCDENRLRQVFLNLIKNAIEAMPDGGDLKITLQNDGQQTTVVVEDTGVGIPKHLVKKIGEPFFTTKESGTGLGLMITYKIMENHKGRFEVESEENKGTRFILRFPSVPDN
ncbi:MAG: PAS domain-containing protein [Bacillus sp. (in: firmicutes)]